jgi:hypothetical protein
MRAMDRTEMADMLRRLATGIYGGAPVPPAEGGRFFHAVCEECRRREDMYWTERRIHELAREIGLWPWSFAQIHTALRTELTPALEPEPAAESTSTKPSRSRSQASRCTAEDALDG